MHTDDARGLSELAETTMLFFARMFACWKCLEFFPTNFVLLELLIGQSKCCLSSGDDFLAKKKLLY